MVDEPMANDGVPAAALTERNAQGVLEPMPTLPVLVGFKRMLLLPPGCMVRSVLMVEILPPESVSPLEVRMLPAFSPPAMVEVPLASVPWTSKKPLMTVLVPVLFDKTERLPP